MFHYNILKTHFLCLFLLTACGSPSPVTTIVAQEADMLELTPPTASPTSEPTIIPELTATPTVASSISLGISRSDAANFFQFLEFDFELTQNTQGEEEYVGSISDGLATVNIIGPEDGITSIYLVIDIPTPPSENQSTRFMLYLATVLSVAAEDWEEGTDWLTEKLNEMGESRTSFDGREAILLLEPSTNEMHVEFTIAALQ